MMTLKPTKTERIATLERELAEAHKAMRDAAAILRGIDFQSETVPYEIGRAQGTISRGLVMSGEYLRWGAK